jgi:RHS repeat-associated protein
VSVDTGALSQNIRFPGQWFQAETGLYQNWMRDYDPTTGRYLEADPLGLVDGPSVYGYARQSPVRWTDPEGLFVFPQGCAGGPVTCAGSAVVEMLIVGVLILNAPDVPDLPSGNDVNGDCGDPCEEIYAEIDRTWREIWKRIKANQENKKGLLIGHTMQIIEKQQYLRKLIRDAFAMGCRNIDPRAHHMAWTHPHGPRRPGGAPSGGFSD